MPLLWQVTYCRSGDRWRNGPLFRDECEALRYAYDLRRHARCFGRRCETRVVRCFGECFAGGE